MPIRVLIVDDSSTARVMLREVFSPNRFDVVGEATNGREAIERYAALKPDLVVMDLVMPLMGGLDATRAIVASDRAAKIVIFSALGQDALVMEALDAGACDFVKKPLRPEELLKVVDRALAR